MDRKFITVFCLFSSFHLLNSHPTYNKNDQLEDETLNAYEDTAISDFDTDLPKEDLNIKYTWDDDYPLSKSQENNEYSNEYFQHSEGDHVDLTYDGQIHKDVKRDNHEEPSLADEENQYDLQTDLAPASSEGVDPSPAEEDNQHDVHTPEEDPPPVEEENQHGVLEEEKPEEDQGIDEKIEEKNPEDEKAETVIAKEENPEVEIPEVETPEEEQPKVETPEEEEPKVETPEEEEPKVETPEEEQHEEEKPEEQILEEQKPEDETTTVTADEVFEEHPENYEETTIVPEKDDEISENKDQTSDGNEEIKPVDDTSFQRSSGNVKTHADLTAHDISDDNLHISYFPENVPAGPVAPQTRIVGGTRVTNREEFAYQASLRYASNSHFCGASIIDDRNILTAAHCVYDDNHKLFPASKLLIVVGDLNVLDQTEHTVIRMVQEIIPHPGYDYKTFQNDIAVLKIQSLGEFTTYVNKIELTSQTPEVGTNCVVSGWGKTSFNGLPSFSLMKATVPIQSTQNCMKGYGNNILDGMLCAGLMEGGKDACQGDSGGPLVCNNQLAGVVSWGYNCALKNYPGVYTDVAFYLDWIREQQAVGRDDGIQEEEGGEQFDVEARKTGRIAEKREAFSYQASLRYKKINSHFCGATIIDSTHLLTAANCLINDGNVIDPASLDVVVGDLNILEETDSTEYRTLANIFTHPDYNSTTFENDIAVIRVSEPFEQWSQDINPIEIADKSPEFYSSCTVSGWGSKSSPTSPSEFLRYTSIPIIETRTCFDYYSEALKSGMLCAGFLEKGKDTCQGDSGGPLVCNNKLSGVVSWGHRCANEGLPGIYTDVAVYKPWIEEQKARSEASSTKFNLYIFVLSCLLLKNVGSF